MKQGAWIGFVVALLMAACSSSPSASVRYASPDPTLAAIDSLLWTWPDSAFAQLQVFAESHEVDSLNNFNGHYFHLLLSELLYKNDYTQTNRDELLQAVDYYDSLVAVFGARVDDDFVFLDARSHYINGVGYFEMDSVVPACSEYLRAVELMEEHFGEEELMGKKAHFMALAYTRLTELFSNFYLHEQAVFYGKQALRFYHRYHSEPNNIAWALNKVGSHYYMTGQLDSAEYYYNSALVVLPDSNNQAYRDVSALMSMLSYDRGNHPQESIGELRHLVDLAENEQEYLIRCLNISGMLYKEGLYDSAWVYLTRVFEESNSLEARKQAAEWLLEIGTLQGVGTALYSEFLAPFANQDEHNSVLKSQLNELYSVSCLKRMELQRLRLSKANIAWTTAVVAGLVFLVLTVIILYHKKKKQLESFEHKVMNEGSLSDKRNHERFLNEPICREIILSVQGKTIKRSSESRDFQDIMLNDGKLQELSQTVNRYFGPIENQFEESGIRFNPTLLNQCHLYLLGLSETQIAVLLDRDYSTIIRGRKKLQNALKTRKDVSVILNEFALNK